ncbi:unnamed protein product [Effrenium voratum]|nr:unnamed protein product [Effrenium voratum]
MSAGGGEGGSHGAALRRATRGGGVMRGERRGKGGITIPADTEDETIIGDGAIRQYVKVVQEGTTQTIKVNIDANEKPAKLKQLIHDCFGWLPEKQRWVFAGKMLDDDKSVYDQSLSEPELTYHLILAD